MNVFKKFWNKLTGKKFKFTRYVFIDPNKKSPYLEKCIGKTVRINTESGEIEIKIKELAHSFKYPDRAVINGEYFIGYFDLFEQIDVGDPSEEEMEQLRREFAELKPEQQRAILGYDDKLNKFLK